MNSNLRNVLKGDRRAMSRLISDSEDFPEKATKILNSFFNILEELTQLALQDPPGCGKSILVEKLALRDQGKTGKRSK